MPKVGTKLFFPENRNTGISYCRLLLNDTMLKDDSYRTGTSESPLCNCGLESWNVDRQSIFLLKCNRYRHVRDVMFQIQTVNAVWMSTQQKRRLTVSEQFLLAPM